MSEPDLYLRGKRLDFVKRIGKGGEGEVWLSASEPKFAVKYYTLGDPMSREAKVRAMIMLGLADAHKFISYPREVVTTKAGSFAGFTMSLVDGGRQIHELWGVKSRKINFPDKDYRFLVRAAANTACAVAQVHASPCVIGDLNESGILVADNATVALIDADSFQLQTDGKTYPCLVGKPDFTPPELQGKSLSGIVRTQVHDQFGLAVAVFQLLCMGRHPYAGRCKGPDLTLDQFVARNLFAYSLSRSNGVTPPPGAITLESFPPEIVSAFERAFGTDPNQRPSAVEWVSRLQALENRLSHCAADASHYYPSAAKDCPWCKIEVATGAILFLRNVAGVNLGVELGAFDVDKVWAAIVAMVVPDPLALMPPLPVLPKEPSEAARHAKRAAIWPKIGGVTLGVLMIFLWISFPNQFIFWIGGIVAALYVYKRPGIDHADWQKKFSDAERRLDEALIQWRTRLGHIRFTSLRAEVEQAVTEFKGLATSKAHAHAKLISERRQRQLNDYLDRFLIQRASISGIGPARTATLRSFGVESAADVDLYGIMQIPGFGPAMAEKLIAWRTNLEKGFTYRPMRTPNDAAAEARVESDFAAKRSALSKKIIGGQQELVQLIATMRRFIQIEDPRVTELVKIRAQLAVDLGHLGVSKPASTSPSALRRSATP